MVEEACQSESKVNECVDLHTDTRIISDYYITRWIVLHPGLLPQMEKVP